jgi:hypothetical protein
MQRAADYTTKLVWYKITRVVNPDDGQPVNTYANVGTLRCSVDETSGRHQQEDGSPQTGAQADIRIRQYPDFGALDLLYDPAFAYVWRTDSVRVGDNELILDSFRLDNDTLEQHGIEVD